MRLALLVAVAALTGCFSDRSLGAFDDAGMSEGGQTDGGGMPGTEGPMTDGGSPQDWPPAEFDPVPDIGDRTLDDDLLLIADTGSGRLYLHLFAQRLGDTFQGQIRAARFAGDGWEPAGPELFVNTGGVDGNEVTVSVEALELPAGTHAFGSEAVVVDVIARSRLYADELLCGTLDLDFLGRPDQLALPFVALPIDEVGADPAPPRQCE